MGKRKRWRYTAGGYGSTVTVFERAGRPCLYIKYWSRDQGSYVRRALGHTDRDLAISQARELSDVLRKRGDSASPGSAALTRTEPAQPPSIKALLIAYARERSRVKPLRQRREDKRRRRLWLHFFACRRQPVVTIQDLGQTVIEDFIRLRTFGDLRVPKLELAAPTPDPSRDEARLPAVKPRTVHADLVFLNAVLNWAREVRVNGRRWIPENPITIPKLTTDVPKRPVVTHDDHRALLQVADEVDPERRLGCLLRLLDDLGWRVTGTCHIRASDLDLSVHETAPYGSIRKNPRVDKKRQEQWVPLSKHARATFNRLLRLRQAEPRPSEFLFPAPRDPDRPWSRFRVRDLIKRAEEAAGIKHIGGAHSWRRKWATERKDYPTEDVMLAGGWNDRRSLEEAYSQPDPHTTLQVVTKPTRRVRRSAATINPTR